MKKIVSMLSRLFYAQGILALTGILRNKVLAYNLHQSGLGVFGLMSNASLMFYTIAAFSLTGGIARNVAAADTQEERQQFLSVANFITLGGSVAVFLICAGIVFTGNADRAFGIGTDPKLGWMMLFLVGLSVVDAWRANYYAVLQGLADLKGIGPERAYGVFIASVVTLPLVFYFGIFGAVLQFALITGLQMAVHAHRVWHLKFHPWSFYWSTPIAKKLFAIGFTYLAFYVGDRLTDTIVRTNLEHAVGIKKIGTLVAALSLSGQLKGIIAVSIATYALSTVSKEKTTAGQSKAVNDIMSVLIPATTYISAALTLFAPILIRILFTKEFSSANQLIGLIVAGDYATNASAIMITPLLAQEKFKEWLILDMILLFNRTWMSLILIGHFGVLAYPIGALASMVIHYACVVWTFKSIAKLDPNVLLVIRFMLGLAVLTGAALVLQIAGWWPALVVVLTLGVLFAFDMKAFDLIRRFKELMASRKAPPPAEA